MGMFSCACTKCGEKSQFDWANQCVLKIGDVYARGYYDSYGGVSIRIEGGSNAKIMAYHEQFAQYFTGWDVSSDALLASEIYCDGDGMQDPTKLLNQQRGMDRMAMLRGMMGGAGASDEEGCDRHCAPKGITILDALDVSLLESLPKASSAAAKKKPRTEATEATKKKKENETPKKKSKSAKF